MTDILLPNVSYDDDDGDDDDEEETIQQPNSMDGTRMIDLITN